MQITFLGGVGTVTGSKFLFEAVGKRILIDCGLFQGFKPLRLRNWSPPPVEPARIDTVVLTHAHIDHSGYLPLLVKNGFAGRVLCTEATADLCGVLLPDCGHLFEREAEFANRYGFSKHKPALPLYTQKDAAEALTRFHLVPFERDTDLGGGLVLRFLYAGHILGAAMARFTAEGRTVLFSGDLGRPNSSIMVDPEPVRSADTLVVESTYGNRRHEQRDPEDALAEVIDRTAARGGTVLIPAFAVGRTQTLLHHLYRLKQAKRIPDLPVYLDSPMAIDASEIFCKHPRDHRLSASQARAACNVARYVQSVEESKSLDTNHVPKVIISASGMATGGRVVHHLKVVAPNPRNSILFAGFQAGGTRGAAMIAGAQEIKIHGSYVPVRAEVDNLDMLSAHADFEEILAWLGYFETPPAATFVVHGEPEAADAMRLKIEERLGWSNVSIPEYRDTVTLP
jgi:metallo-beta-lactamase family protein